MNSELGVFTRSEGVQVSWREGAVLPYHGDKKRAKPEGKTLDLPVSLLSIPYL